MNSSTQSYEVEQALIGSLLKNPYQYPALRDALTVDDFSNASLRDVWEAMGRLHEQHLTIDTVTVGDELERMGRLNDVATIDNHHFGHVALSYLRDEGEPEAAGSYAAKVRDYAAKRLMEQEAVQMATWARNGRSAAAIQTDMVQRIAAIRVPHAASTRTQTLEQSISEAIDETLRASNGEIFSVPTGYIDLDELLDGGMYAPDLHIVAGRPGQGKTSLLLSLAKNAAEARKRTALFTLEMANKEVSLRLMAMESGVSFGKMRQGKLTQQEWEAFYAAADKLASKADPYPIVMNDLPAITISGIRRELTRMGKVDLVMVDYLQLAGADGRYDSRVREVTEVSSGLKAIAKEFNVPVLAAAQLSRAVEQRADKKPFLSDLRESGSIEQDADIVAFLYRPHEDDPQPEIRNQTQVIVAKHRNGRVGYVDLIFRPERARFENAAARHFAPNQ